MTPATCFPDHCFCEAISIGSMLQPISTWSSLAFVLAGLIILLQSRQWWARLYAVTAIVIGSGSFFYHWKLTYVGQLWDILGMYLLMTFVVALLIKRVHGVRSSVVAVGFVLVNAVLFFVQYMVPELRRYVFAALVVGFILWLVQHRKRFPLSKQLYVALGIFAAGFVIWVLDITGIWCDPNSFLQGHALWHILGAISVYALYLYLKNTHASIQEKTY